MSALIPNFDEAAAFLDTLGHTDEQHSFQTFDDSAQRTGSLTRIFHGTFDQHKDTLAHLNQQGAGIFVTVNQTNGSGRKKENITAVKAIWQDDDDGFSGEYPIEPSIVVQSSEGKYQRYWLCEHITPDQHKKSMERMVADYGADPNAKDLARILRVPGFYHNKREPQLVKIIGEINSKPYTASEIISAFPSLSASEGEAANTPTRTRGDINPGSSHRNSDITSYIGTLVNKGLSTEEIRPLVYTANQAFNSPLGESEIDNIISSAERNFTRATNSLDPETALEMMNKEFAITTLGSKVRIMKQIVDQFGRPTQVFYVKADFLLETANYSKVQNGENSSPVGNWWLSHPMRRQYTGLTFNPSHTPKGYFNLWRGFSVEPSEGGCSLFLDHCLNTVCNGDKALYEYLISWLAHLFQHPEEKIGVAIILRGRKGTGKGVFMNTIGSLLGSHYTLISQQRHLTGNFNAHFAETLLLGGDEITWGGDIQGEGPLKSLITEDTVMLERKGIDPVQIPSFMRVIICTNSDWSVPASGDERRYLVLDISDQRKKDFEYFKTIKNQMDNGGREALLHHLLNHKISDSIELRDPPRTAGLQDQVELSLRPAEQWWFEVLKERSIPHRGADGIGLSTVRLHYPLDAAIDDYSTKYVMHHGALFISVYGKLTPYTDIYKPSPPRTTLSDSFILYQRDTGLSARSVSTTVGRMIANAHPTAQSSGNSDRAYRLGDLATLRMEFERNVLGFEYDWDWGTGDCCPIEGDESNINIRCYPRCDALYQHIIRLEQRYQPQQPF